MTKKRELQINVCSTKQLSNRLGDKEQRFFQVVGNQGK